MSGTKRCNHPVNLFYSSAPFFKTDHTGFVGTNLYLLNLPINMHYRDELNIDGAKHVFACLNKLRIILNE